jgi:Cys-tRNA(Pro)/Cys-tRNA(Cys) deacylase
MEPSHKTNAVRIVESLGTAYQLAAYEVSEEHLDAETVARQLGVSPDIVFKTLVAHDDQNQVAVFCLPANAELDLKKAARAAKAKRMELINLKDLLPLTGYVRGGCSPIGMKKKYPVFLDELASLCDKIYVNAGAKGLQIVLAPADLVRICDAQLCDVSKNASSGLL